jgi:hypothetical protein
MTSRSGSLAVNNDDSAAVRSTADDAILAKLSCAERGYYNDPFLRPMSSGVAGGSSGRGWNNATHKRSTAAGGGGIMMSNEGGAGPMIRRGTHARVMALGRVIDAFLSIDIPSSSFSSESLREEEVEIEGEENGVVVETNGVAGGQQQQQQQQQQRRRRHQKQIVILGAGRDTAYLRYRFGEIRKKRKQINVVLKDPNSDDEDDDDVEDDDDDDDQDYDVHWYEVDHPSTVNQKAKLWLPKCIPNEYKYDYIEQHHTTNGDDDGDGNTSYTIQLSPRQKYDNDGNILLSSCNYHLIGHDLRSSPDALFRKLSLPAHGYIEPSTSNHDTTYYTSCSTLFIMECVAMYMPEVSVRNLLHRIARSSSSSTLSSRANDSVSSFTLLAIYDPIPGNDNFGRLMINNLKRRGIVTGVVLPPRKSDADNDDIDINDENEVLSLERTRTLHDQLSRLVHSCGFDIAIGCNMMDAYDHGVVRSEDRQRACQCEMLDELEEFVLLMKHYCLALGVATASSSSSTINFGTQLCSVGVDSQMGFSEGRCTVMKRDTSDGRNVGE